MRILLTSHRFWPHVGGTETVVEQLATRFAKKGHEVVVATSGEEGAPAEEDRNGFGIRRFAMTRRAGFRVPPPEYRRLVQSDHWDLVHLHGQRIWSTDFLYRHFGGVSAPIVFTAHGFYQWHMERRPVIDPLYYRVVLPRALRKVARAVAITTNEKQELASWGVPPERIEVIPDGFDPAEFETPHAGFRRKHGYAENEPLLLYVGGFYRNKRVDRLIDVAAQTGAHLIVVGKDQDPERGRPYCERLAKQLGANVSFLGTLPRADVLGAYRECDVFVLASDFEGFGLVLLEAMAAGLPFVSTPAGAAPDLAREGAGLLAPDAQGMARAVREILANPDRRASLSQAGRARVAAYTWDAVAERHLQLYEEVQRR